MTKNAETLIKEHLQNGELMQLATVRDNKPWNCTVYFVELDGKIYWLSWPERRHSREIADNPHVAAAIVVKADWPVIGVQIEGIADVVDDADEVKRVMDVYTEKYHGFGKDFYELFMAGENKHQMYRLTPEHVTMFDELNFPGHGSQTVSLT